MNGNVTTVYKGSFLPRFLFVAHAHAHGHGLNVCQQTLLAWTKLRKHVYKPNGVVFPKLFNSMESMLTKLPRFSKISGFTSSKCSSWGVFSKPVFSRGVLFKVANPRHASLTMLTSCKAGNEERFRRRRSQIPEYDVRVRNLDPRSIQRVVSKFALPTLLVLGAASMLGPLIAVFSMTAILSTMAIAACAAVFSISWIFVPFLAAIFGVPLLIGGGIASGLFWGAASMAILPIVMLQLGFIASAFWIGLSVTKMLWFSQQKPKADVDKDIIEVESSNVMDAEDDTEYDLHQRELQEFDELLQRRQNFQRSRDRLT